MILNFAVVIHRGGGQLTHRPRCRWPALQSLSLPFCGTDSKSSSRPCQSPILLQIIGRRHHPNKPAQKCTLYAGTPAASGQFSADIFGQDAEQSGIAFAADHTAGHILQRHPVLAFRDKPRHADADVFER